MGEQKGPSYPSRAFKGDHRRNACSEEQVKRLETVALYFLRLIPVCDARHGCLSPPRNTLLYF